MPADPAPPSLPKKPVRWSRLAGLAVWTAVVAGGYALYSGAVTVPERYNPYNPWAPLNTLAQPNFLTPYKLARARGNPALCRQALAGTGMQYEPLPNRITGPGCGFKNAVLVRSAGVRLGVPLSLSCPMALSLAMWERHALQPAAQLHFGQPVVAVEHLGSYACRNVNTGEGAAPNAAPRNRSRHATADALDISGLTLTSGKRITLLKDFRRSDAGTSTTPEAAFLDDVHARACTYFTGVLGPNYNAIHRDHLHLETGGYGMCR